MQQTTRGGFLLDRWAAENPERYRALVVTLGKDQSQVWRWRRAGGIPRADDATVISQATNGAVPVSAWAEVIEQPQA